MFYFHFIWENKIKPRLLCTSYDWEGLQLYGLSLGPNPNSVHFKPCSSLAVPLDCEEIERRACKILNQTLSCFFSSVLLSKIFVLQKHFEFSLILLQLSYTN